MLCCPSLFLAALTVRYFQPRPVSLPSVHVNHKHSDFILLHFITWNISATGSFSGIFSTQEKKKQEKKSVEQNERLTSRMEKEKKNDKETWHEQAFIVLCIYAIVYVWIWRIWKYMLTNLYRVFYVMWNTWSRCSLVSLWLSSSFSFYVFSLVPHLFQSNISEKWHDNFEGSFFFFYLQGHKCLHSSSWILVRNARLCPEKMAVLDSCWWMRRKRREVDFFRLLVSETRFLKILMDVSYGRSHHEILSLLGGIWLCFWPCVSKYLPAADHLVLQKYNNCQSSLVISKRISIAFCNHAQPHYHDSCF